VAEFDRPIIAAMPVLPVDASTSVSPARAARRAAPPSTCATIRSLIDLDGHLSAGKDAHAGLSVSPWSSTSGVCPIRSMTFARR
jgi:hypothetical protein